MLSSRELVSMDTECWQNYWLIGFKHVLTRKTKFYQFYEGHPLNVEAIRKMLNQFCIVTFNGNNYDLPMVALALSGASNETLKAASDRIIQDNVKPWDLESEFEYRRLRGIDHIDLFDVAPGKVSLKTYGGRMHSRRLQDLPIEHTAIIAPEQRPIIVEYNLNDLDTNIDMLDNLKEQLELRVAMGKEYGLDLRSKSDAQIAEAVIVSQVEKRSGRKVYKSKKAIAPFKYEAPDFIKFKTPYMQNILDMITSQTFKVKVVNGKVEMPDHIANANIKIGNSRYTLGIGGLHSCEESVAHYSDEDVVLLDRDFRSFYPELIIKLGLFPPQLGKVFLEIYNEILQKRIAAKLALLIIIAESLKIVVNGSFGKFGDPWSKLYSPNLLIQTTVTGQLLLLMLIEQFELEGIPVVSANTDGIVMKCPREKRDRLNHIFTVFEFDSDFVTEETEYEALFSRDVNNYIAVKKKDGSLKLKGVYGKIGLSKNPTSAVCVDAVVAFIKDKVPFEETLRKTTDIRRFLNVRNVAGGALFYKHDPLPRTAKCTLKFMRQVVDDYEKEHGELPEDNLKWKYENIYQASVNSEHRYLGKVVRWYYSTENTAPLRYKNKLKTVSLSHGAMPMMELVEGIPDDLDFEKYLKMSQDILVDLGIKPKPAVQKTAMQLKREHNAMVKKFDMEIAAL